MKYNKSNVMKTAWIFKKKNITMSFSECLRHAWGIEKRNAKIREEKERYFKSICESVIADGEEAVEDAFYEYRTEGYKKETSMPDYITAHTKAWKDALAVFRGKYAPMMVFMC